MLLKSDEQNVSSPVVGYSLYPHIFKQNPFLDTHISEKAKKHTWRKQDFDRLFSSDPFLSPPYISAKSVP